MTFVTGQILTAAELNALDTRIVSLEDSSVANIVELKDLDKTKITYARTKGYWAAGDNGWGNYWCDLSDTTSADNGFSVIVGNDGGRWKLLFNEVGVGNVRQAGAKGDGTTDDYASIAVVIAYLVSIDGGTLFFPSGEFLSLYELVVPIDGIIVKGVGSGDKLYSETGSASSIIGGSLTGSVIRFKRSGCSISDIAIKATVARTAAARNTTNASYNSGIRFEADDTTGITDRVEGFSVSNVKVTGQPNDGLIAVAGCFQSTIRDSYFYQNGGIGLVIDSGNRTNRVNKNAPGPITLNNIVSNYNVGNGFAFGNPYDDAALIVSSLRIIAVNCEASNNNCDTTGGNAYEAYEWYIRGDHIITEACAATGKNKLNIANHHGGMITAGRTQKHIGFRALSVTRPIKVHAYTTETTGIRFDSVAVRSMTATEVMEIVGNCVGIEINCDDIIDIPTTVVTDNTSSGLRQRRRDYSRTNGTFQASVFKSTNQITIADDGLATIEMSASGTSGLAIISCNLAGAMPSIIAFRVGSSNYTETVAGMATTTTGVLTGTTGVDGAVTYSTDAGTNLLYIENRRGASANFSITFLGCLDGTPAAGI